MANNPYVNKVEYAGQTIMDLTNDTITPSDVLNGATFHDRSGTPQTGSLITHGVYDGLDSSSVDDALSANQGKVLYSILSLFLNARPSSDMNGNCNNATEPGLWSFTNTQSNRPFDYGIIKTDVYDIDGWITQVAIGVTSNRIAIRSKNGNTWSAWDELALNNDLVALSTVSFASLTSVPSGVTLRDANIKKCNKHVSGYIEVVAPGNAATTIGTISNSALHPLRTFYFPMWHRTTSQHCGYVEISSSGAITTRPISGLSETIVLGFSMNYIVG